MAIKEKEKRIYTIEELEKFHLTLVRYFKTLEHKDEESGVVIVAEYVDHTGLQEAFCKSKPEVPREERLEELENLISQWTQWKVNIIGKAMYDSQQINKSYPDK